MMWQNKLDNKQIKNIRMIVIFRKIAIHRKSGKGNWKKTLSLRVSACSIQSGPVTWCNRHHQARLLRLLGEDTPQNLIIPMISVQVEPPSQEEREKMREFLLKK